MTLTSRPSAPAPRRPGGPAAPKAPSTIAARMAASASSASAQTVTPLPAARPSALTTTRPPSARASADGRDRVVERRALGHRHAGRLATSRQKALLPSSRAASAPGPKTASPRARSASASAGHERAPPGPTTTRSATARRPAPRWPPVASRATIGVHGGHVRHARVAWRDQDSPTPRSRGQAPGERVLPAAGAHHEHRARHRQACPSTRAGAPTAARSRPRRAHDRLGAFRTDADERDGHAGQLLEGVHVRRGRRRQRPPCVRMSPRSRVPAGKRLVDRLGALQLVERQRPARRRDRRPGSRCTAGPRRGRTGCPAC